MGFYGGAYGLVAYLIVSPPDYSSDRAGLTHSKPRTSPSALPVALLQCRARSCWS